MSLLDKMKIRSFEKSLDSNANTKPIGQALQFNSIKTIIVLIEANLYDKSFKQFIVTLEKNAIVQVIVFEDSKQKEIEDKYLFTSAQTTWAHLPPESIINQWQSFKTDMVINYFDAQNKSLTYLSAILDQKFSVGVFENKWLQNDITISLKELSSSEFSKMFYYLLSSTNKKIDSILS